MENVWVRRALFLFISLVLLIALIALKWSLGGGDKLPTFGQIATFKLVDQSGAAFNSESLIGKVWTLNLFFASCKGPCPLVMGRVARLVKATSKDNGGKEMAFVSISVDPSRDTADVLSQYAESMGSWQNWFMLTGDLQDIRELVVPTLSLEGIEENPDLHSTKVILVDSKGQVRGFYAGLDDESMAELKEDIRILRSE